MTAAVLFDVGNTLLHLDYAWVAEHFGRPLHEVRAAEMSVRQGLKGHSGNYFLDVAGRLGLPPGSGHAVLVEHDRRPEGLWCVPDPDAVPVLCELGQRGVRLGVISNADGRVRKQLEMAGLASYFAVIVDSAEVGMSKPEPGIFQVAAERLGVAPADCIYVGDIYQIDVLGAQAAGMRALWLADASHNAPERIDRLSDILDRADFGGA
ncbi:MAG TPA: HAD-IA family hydrolase [Bacillota bacterium]|nr:HAD-IA family hydrolase [Bacillota bacterium]